MAATRYPSDLAVALALEGISKDPTFPGAVPTKFFAAAGAVNGNQTLYTVPAGFVAIYKHIDVAATNAITNGRLYYRGNQPWGGDLGFIGLPANNSIEFDGFYVANAGDTFVANLDASFANCYVTASGLLLPTPVAYPQPVAILANLTAVGDTVIYTVPPNRKLILLTAVVSEESGINNTFELRVDPGNPIVFPALGAIAAGSAQQSDGYWVCNAGDRFTANIGSAGGSRVVFSLSGVLI